MSPSSGNWRQQVLGHILKVLGLSLCAYIAYILIQRQDSSVGIVTGYGLDSWVSTPGSGNRFFIIPQRPDRLWVPFSFLSNGYCGLFLQR
jgi:hypothetical protein